MVYAYLRKELPTLTKRQEKKARAHKPRVITISLLNPPLTYRLETHTVRTLKVPLLLAD